MTKAETLFHEIASSIPDTAEGKMFGALCIKAPNGKAGVMYWHDELIFKLDESKVREAIALKGAKLFDPMGGRPMKEWVQLSETHSKKWKKYAVIAMDYVSAQSAKPNKPTKKQ